jgi:hypothetical protein
VMSVILLPSYKAWRGTFENSHELFPSRQLPDSNQAEPSEIPFRTKFTDVSELFRFSASMISSAFDNLDDCCKPTGLLQGVSYWVGISSWHWALQILH